MAFKNLGLVSSIWQNSGLKYLLFPNEEGIREVLQTSKTAARKGPQFTGSKLAKNSGNLTQPDRQKVTPPIKTSIRNTWKPIPVTEWPDIWKKQFEKTRKGMVAWTYWDLGLDFDTSINKDKNYEMRKKILQSLIRDLHHPAGTHTFWPMALSASSIYTPAPEIFWSGLSLLGARGTVIMGSQAAQSLIANTKLQPLVEMRMKGQFVWILQDINNISLNENSYSKVLVFLANALKRFIRN